MNLETPAGRELVALILFAGCLAVLLAIHVQVELTAIRREIRRLRRQVRRASTNPAASAAIPNQGGSTAHRPPEEEMKSP